MKPGYNAGAAAIALALFASSGASAQSASGAGTTQPRITTDCRNRSKSDEEIVVCGGRTAEDPYRIPKAFRNKAKEESEAGNAKVLDAMGSGIPGAGTNAGPAGSATSSRSLYDQWRAEQAKEKEADAMPE